MAVKSETQPSDAPPSAVGRMTRRGSLAAILGAGIGFGQNAAAQSPSGPAAARVTSVHGKLRHVVSASDDYGLTPGGSAAANAAALQRAVNEAQVVLLPSSDDVIALASAVTVPPGTAIVGAGRGRTRLIAHGPQAFIYQAPPGTAVVEGPVFAELSIQCALVGIKLNDESGGFTNTAASQQYMMRPLLDRVRLSGPGADVADSRGVVWNKVFEGIIDQTEISGFQIGVKTLGCDLCEIRGRSRIWVCGTLLQIERSGDFGSGFKVDGCDLLLAGTSFLKASDRHLIFVNNYLESQAVTPNGPIFDLDFDYIMLFENNRIEVPAVPAGSGTLLKVSGEGLLFVFANNGTRGLPWGRIDWNGNNSARYHYNSVHRQRIMASGNSPPVRVPFATVEPAPPRNAFRDLWVITPATAGLAPSFNYSNQCRVRDDAFVLPARAGTGSIVRFRDQDNPADGPVNVRVRARATVAGQELVIAHIQDDRYQAHAVLQLGRASQWHTAFAGIAAGDLALDAYNADTARGGDALIEAIVVERAT